MQRWGYPIVAKVGGLHSQGGKGAAVVGYRKPLATPDMESSGFPRRGKKDGETELVLECTAGWFQ